ncbi:LysR substrate-binding domain-containing protein [Trabulsiella odontotermitis]|uniref:LysR family transcriptional regulator n=1 Tax=Trabulsiella odontotermitis TaxID=379893 RepID=A0A0L0GW07_9ENTR|nr:LysR substrate-binding domain-containing protein [Trabulsiella odontotermitis]KNC93330.1 LysR family transcriptional regulator [Trabulsiella odontotermitis]
MEFRHLRYFLTVAEELHFTRAAEKLNIGQPPLSQQIQSLESELGVKLFNRTKRSVALTEAGEHLVIQAKEILRMSGALQSELRDIEQGKTGELRIGFTTTGLFVDELSHPLKTYRRRYPDVRISLFEMYSQQQFDALLHQDIDIGYVRLTPNTTQDGLDIHILRHDRLCVVLPEDHPEAAKDSLTLADVRHEPFIFYPEKSGAAVPERVRRLSQRAGFTPTVVQEAAEVLTHIGLVAAGVGISVLPKPVDSLRPGGVRFIPLADEDAELCMALVTRSNERNMRILNYISLAAPHA